MLTEREKEFVEYWEANRLHQKKIFTQLISGIPLGLLFALPVMLILFTGRLWYRRADMVAYSSASPLFISIAVFIIAIFFAVFNKRHQWEMKEQQYLELKAKENAAAKRDAAELNNTMSNSSNK